MDLLQRRHTSIITKFYGVLGVACATISINNQNMKYELARFIRTNRKALAVAMLCVLVLKGFSFLGMASSIAKYPEASSQYFSAAVLGTHCDKDPGDGIPQGKHVHHADCCVLCSSATRHEASADVAMLGAVVALLTPQAESRPVPVSYSPQEPRLAFSTGLFSDWSATAPPRA